MALLLMACGGESDPRQEVIEVLETVVSAAGEESIECVLTSLEESGTLSAAGPAMEKVLVGEELTDPEEVALFSIGVAVENCVSEEEFQRSDPSPLFLGSSPGDSALLDTLWSECAEGDYQSCDLLFHLADPGSEYEAFGGSCGDRSETPEYCFDVFVGVLGLEAYASSCNGGDMKACDLLFFRSAPDSPEEAIGITCGGLNEPGLLRCVQRYGYPPEDPSARGKRASGGA